MATPYTIIHQVALSKITDTDILNFTDVEREGIFDEYLLSAISKFKRTCKIDLMDKDSILKQFNQNLDEEIIDILATGEVYYWTLPRVNNIENMRNVLNTKDFSQFSPANLLRELQSLRDYNKKEFRNLVIEYSYNTGNISDKKV